ncbi:type I restriction enzyme, S subunit [Pseudoalteromonas sp. BSi20311]|jgi:type I restriction enzyme S subunit|uniref:restriction endonuclease subunit S n=1 Tax=Pseudoalteromonas sp. BSi20311 TaxID=383911 RepID=UPI000231974C|nr:restriction endonuclease subunit S [Pseudoalteromonas sp. BSi20311]GAA63694.1 type I restriction enzyme, S subunit [Pseudoalteromonas sp. BSi20311]
MAGRYKAYPEYKESGVEWFGYIPRSWSLSRLKFSSLINMGQSPSSDDCNIDGIGLAFLQGNAEFGSKYPTEKQFCPTSKKIAKAGELLFSVRAPVGALNIADKNYGIGRGLCSIRGNSDVEQGFLWWVLPAYKKQFDAVSTGSTFEAVSAEQVGNLAFGLPSNIEQQKIASFLDHETAKIDTLIAKQEKLIELLKEKRQAVISHAVTKGLNPNAPMRDSGVEWLGEVPEHWKVTRFKYLCENIVAGPFGSSITKDMYKKSGYKVYGQEQVIPNNFKIGDYFISTEDYLRLARYKVTKGDVLISCVGTFGKVSVFPSTAQAGIINPRLIKAKIHKANSPYFIREYLKSVTVAKQFDQFSRGGTMGVINIAILNEIISTKPPYVEQCEIYDFIKAQKSKFSLLLDRCEKQIALLKERKTALISAAVTGKIDVRDFVSEQG